MPKTLGFDWCPSGPCGTLLQWLAKGQDRAAYTCQGMVFKLSELPQYQNFVSPAVFLGGGKSLLGRGDCVSSTWP